MNTTLKGDIFENKVFNLIQELLCNDQFYINRRASKIFAKKAYYSKSRNSNIIFDITIESYMPNAEEYSHLIVFECKNLNKNVSIEDIEEFESKLKQVGEHDIKGFMVSTKGFSKSTINFAKYYKIGLIRIQKDNEIEWINYRKKRNHTINFIDSTLPFTSFDENNVFDNLADLLLSLNVIDTYIHNEKYISIPFLTIEKIESLTQRLLKYDVSDNNCINTSKLCQFLRERYQIEFITQLLENNLMGKIEFEPLKITIDSRIDENRFRFTLCHEIGHLILHKKILEEKIYQKQDNNDTLSFHHYLFDSSNRRLEIQANIFANYLLLPEIPFLKEVHRFFKKERINKGFIYLDSQPINIFLTNTLLGLLSVKFKVSKETAKIRLMDLNLLKDNSSFNFKRVLDSLR